MKPTKKNQQIAFASGPSRSGTTLLQLVLSAHPEIHITPETKFTKTLLNISRSNKERRNLSQSNVRVLVEKISNDSFLRSWPYAIQDNLLAYIKQHRKEITPSDIYLHLLKTPKKESEKCAYIGNKQEVFVDGHGPTIKKIFPDAKFIIIVRDPRDVAKSVIQNFSRERDRGVMKSATTTFSANKYINQLKSKYPKDVLVIRYEDLILSPRNTCMEICDYLNLQYSDNMINFYKKNQSGELLIGNTKNIHQNLTGSFNQSLANQWKTSDFFNKNELSIIELINKKYMSQYGYQREFSQQGFLKSLIYIAFVFARFQYKRIKYKYF